MKTKAIIFDIDGTAIDSPSQKLPTERLKLAASNLKGQVYLCAATGRVWSYAKPVLQGLDLDDPCIISAGTQICNPKTGKILWQSELAPADLDEVVEIVKRYPQYKILFNDHEEDSYLYGGHNPADLSISEPVYYFEIAFVPHAIAPKIVTEISQIEGVAVTLVVAQRPGYNDIHVTNRNATKEHAVAELLKILKVDQEHTTGIGDGHNDIHLFNAVKRKVAMGNAVDELKLMADEVIGNVDKDGLAHYFESRLSSPNSMH
jgi:Cof subfamily protein (haloacid dehalogenase superfamily)